MSKSFICDGQSPFFGCRFSLYPMTNDFVPIIFEAIEELKIPGLIVESSHISTCVMGLETYVFAALKAMFSKATSTQKHIVLSATFSKGCPGEGLVDLNEYRQSINEPLPRNSATDTIIDAEFSIYPLGDGEYMTTIYDIIQLTKDEGVYDQSVHFATRLSGTIEAVFNVLEQAFERTSKVASHTVMQVTLSSNSPSVKKGGN